jgi:hypothetical protein
VTQGIVFFVNLLQTIEPQWVSELAASVQEGGLAGVRKRLRELLDQSPAVTPTSEPDSAPDYRSLGAADYRGLLKRLPTKVAIAKHLGIDAKTLAKQLAEHGLTRSSKSSSTRRTRR